MKPRRTSNDDPMSALDQSRNARHTDVLAQVMYDRVGAEMRGVAECMATYFDTLMVGGFSRDEAVVLTRDWAVSYWSHVNMRAHE